MHDLGDWLSRNGLGRYAELFAENRIDLDVLPELTEADLKELGIPLGDRKRLLRAAAAPIGETEPAAPPPARPQEAERRQLTVMFADLAGSTALASVLDPEEMRDVIASFQACVAAEVRHHGGHVAKYMGDGVLIYFGYPRAREDDAGRAVAAGLAIAAAVGRLHAPHGSPLACRVGIATGLVVVGDLVGAGAAQEEAVVGETPNLAARLQGFADPGEVLISEPTFRLSGHGFDTVECPARAAKGLAEPVRFWRVTGTRAAETRFEARPAQELTALVGRSHECGLLDDRWHRTQDGEGQVLLLGGEAGIGKSRMIAALTERVDQAARLVRLQCSDLHHASTLFPVVRQIERAAGIVPEDSAGDRQRKLAALLAEGVPGDTAGVAEAATALVPLLASPDRPTGHLVELPDRDAKERTFTILLDHLANLAREKPVLFVVEDAQWIDPTTSELIGRMIERIRDLPVLVMVSHRRSFAPPWGDHAHVTRLSLNRLSRRQTADLALAAAGGKALPQQLTERIVELADGVPLFVEELVGALIDSGRLEDLGDRFALADPAAPVPVPATLQETLLARLDRLGPAREAAQVAAALGREFPLRLIAGVMERPEPQMAADLAPLVEAGVLDRRALPAGEGYLFRHTLLRDAAYDTLLKSRRQSLHRRVAAVLERDLPDAAAREPELVAHHLTEARAHAEAARWWYRAGQLAAIRWAPREAVSHYTRSVELIGQSADPADLAELELDCHVGIGALTVWMNGPGDPEAGRHYDRASELCAGVADDRRSYKVVWGQWFIEHFGRGNPTFASGVADRLLELAERQGDRGLLLQAHHSAWTSCWSSDDLHGALDHIDRGIELYDPAEHGHQAAEFGGHDAGVCCHCLGAILNSVTGRFERAARLADRAVALSRQIGHGFSEVYALGFTATTHLLRRDADRLVAGIEDLEAVVGEGAGPYMLFAATGRMLKGWGWVQQGRVDEGLALLAGNLEILRAARFPRVAFQLGQMAEALIAAGRPAEAVPLLEDAFANIRATGERLWTAELHRIRGAARLALGDGDAARADFTEALHLAEAQEAALFELRAATALAGLLSDSGQTDAARAVLAPAFAKLSEGFDVPDARQAAGLLRDLG